MTEKIMYTAIIWLPDEKGKDFGVTFPDFPGCVSAGSTMNEALNESKEALIFHIEGMLEDDEEIPEPSSLDEVLHQIEGEDWYRKTMDEILNRNFVPSMVTIPKPQKAVRFNIHASAAELVRIDKAAEKLGKPRSRFLVESALEKAKHL